MIIGLYTLSFSLGINFTSQKLISSARWNLHDHNFRFRLFQGEGNFREEVIAQIDHGVVARFPDRQQQNDGAQKHHGAAQEEGGVVRLEAVVQET